MVFFIPLIVCVDTGQATTRKYYTRGQRWEEDGNLSGVDPESPGQAGLPKLQGKLDELKDKYEINLNKTSGTYKASAAGQDIQVTSTPADNQKVPTGYVRHDHKLKNSQSTSTFKLGSVKYNDIPLKGISDNPTTGVTAVYVYYKDSTGDPNHQFPLIVCAYKGTSQTYYKRGNTWTEITELNSQDPDDTSAASKLQPELEKLKDKYEIKLEKPATSYTATPDGSGSITVSAVDESDPDTAKFKGFKHPIPQNKKINRITIHGQVITGITELDGEGHTITGSNGGVYVYFSKDGDNELRRPYLICLSPNGDTNGNTWYKRENNSAGDGYTWSDANTEIGTNIDPNTIDATFAGKLGKIKGELTKDGKTDTGYITLD